MTKKRKRPPDRLPTRAPPHPDDEPQDRDAENAADVPDDAAAVARSLPAVSRVTNASQIRHFVSDIKSAEQQVGEHILAALQEQGTVAVLTAVVIGTDGVQRIVSAALDPEMLQQVQELMQVAEAERQEEEPCVGFHCLLKRKEDGR